MISISDHLTDCSYEASVSGKMTPAMAADYLREGRVIKHSFAEVLRQMYPAEDLGTRLLDLFLSDSQNTAPQSVSRKIRNWLAGKNEPADREDIFRIAFAQRTPGTPLVFDMHSRKFILSQTYAYLEWGILEDLTSVNCTSYFMTVP